MSEQIFRMRVSPEWLTRMDAWRGKQAPIPSRSEVVRSLVTRQLDFEMTDAELRPYISKLEFELGTALHDLGRERETILSLETKIRGITAHDGENRRYLDEILEERDRLKKLLSNRKRRPKQVSSTT